MATYNKDRAIAEVLGEEGGYSNNRFDRGGPTNYGVTQGTYDDYRQSQGLPTQSVTRIDPAEVRDIYESYWDAVAADVLPAGIDLAAFDAAINSGPRRATQQLQDVLGVPRDGVMGPQTIAAARAADPAATVNSFYAAREDFYQGLPNFHEFGRGWMDRVQVMNQAALDLIENETSLRNAHAMGFRGSPEMSAFANPQDPIFGQYRAADDLYERAVAAIDMFGPATVPVQTQPNGFWGTIEDIADGLTRRAGDVAEQVFDQFGNVVSRSALNQRDPMGKQPSIDPQPSIDERINSMLGLPQQAPAVRTEDFYTPPVNPDRLTGIDKLISDRLSTIDTPKPITGYEIEKSWPSRVPDIPTVGQGFKGSPELASVPEAAYPSIGSLGFAGSPEMPGFAPYVNPVAPLAAYPTIPVESAPIKDVDWSTLIGDITGKVTGGFGAGLVGGGFGSVPAPNVSASVTGGFGAGASGGAGFSERSSLDLGGYFEPADLGQYDTIDVSRTDWHDIGPSFYDPSPFSGRQDTVAMGGLPSYDAGTFFDPTPVSTQSQPAPAQTADFRGAGATGSFGGGATGSWDAPAVSGKASVSGGFGGGGGVVTHSATPAPSPDPEPASFVPDVSLPGIAPTIGPVDYTPFSAPTPTSFGTPPVSSTLTPGPLGDFITAAVTPDIPTVASPATNPNIGPKGMPTVKAEPVYTMPKTVAAPPTVKAPPAPKPAPVMAPKPVAPPLALIAPPLPAPINVGTIGGVGATAAQADLLSNYNFDGGMFSRSAAQMRDPMSGGYVNPGLAQAYGAMYGENPLGLPDLGKTLGGLFSGFGDFFGGWGGDSGGSYSDAGGLGGWGGGYGGGLSADAYGSLFDSGGSAYSSGGLMDANGPYL